jgi:phosphoesterase RecJ-like protein
MTIRIPDTDKTIIAEIIDSIKNSRTAFITMHARPDGDAVGAGLAMYKILKKCGLEVEIIAPHKPPTAYDFLSGINEIKTEYSNSRKDLGFVLDCSDITRLEGIDDVLNYADKIINIDHHKVHQKFGDINYIKHRSSSTCELIFNIAYQMGVDLDHDIALYLYVGIVTDTNRFQEENTTPEAHLIAAKMISEFISPIDLSTQIYGNRSMGNLILISKAIDSLTLTESKKSAYITVTPEMLKSTGTTLEDLEGIINYARNIEGVEVGILFRKISTLDGIKVSFRSKGKIDVSALASKFGGGGHHNAAGCLVKGDFKEAMKLVLDTVENEIQRKLLTQNH